MKKVKILLVFFALFLISATLSAQVVNPTGTTITVISNTANQATVYATWDDGILAGTTTQTFYFYFAGIGGGGYQGGSITLWNPLRVDTISFSVTTNTGEHVVLTFTENAPKNITVDFRNTIPLIKHE